MSPIYKPNLFLSWLLSVHDECGLTETLSTHGGLLYCPSTTISMFFICKFSFFPEKRVTCFSVLDFLENLCMHNILQIILASSWSLWICFLECSFPDSETYFFSNEDLNPVSGHLSAAHLPGTLTIICPVRLWKIYLGCRISLSSHIKARTFKLVFQ